MAFFDSPDNRPATSWPSQPGDAVEGTITHLAVLDSPYGRRTLAVELDGDGKKRWANGRLWKALMAAQADVGMRVRVTRGPDDMSNVGASGRPGSTWTVEILELPSATASKEGKKQPPARAGAAPSW